MLLVSFGKLRLQGSVFSRPKPLLVLTYLALEGPQRRARLGDLFWNASKGKNNLSVMLSQFKKEGGETAISGQAGADPLSALVPCDAALFQHTIEAGDDQAALALYQGSFLHDLGKPLEEFDLSAELLDWITVRRERYAQLAQKAMVRLAETQLERHQPEEARQWAERAYQLPDGPEIEPALSVQLQRILWRCGSRLAPSMQHGPHDGLNDLPTQARKLLLALSLQPRPNLTEARQALELSISELAQAQQELQLAGLLGPQGLVLVPELAQHWLSQHPGDHLLLLLNLARATAGPEAIALYRRIYHETQGFGGLGDLTKARSAYAQQAKTHLDALRFTDTIGLLEEVRAVERTVQVEPDPQVAFLHAYALERTERFREALELLEALKEHTPNTLALMGTLLWRTGKVEAAAELARSLLNSNLDWFWSQATAYNVLGYIAGSGGHALEAISYFKKATEYYRLAQDTPRMIGALNNQAVELSKLGGDLLDTRPEEGLNYLNEAEASYRRALSAIEQHQPNPTLSARIQLNLGNIAQSRQDWDRAQERYHTALDTLAGLEAPGLLARIQLNLGYVQRRQGLNTEALTALREAVHHAQRAGELQMQAFALIHLALIHNDLEQLQVGLDLLLQTGGLAIAMQFVNGYHAMLREDIQRSYRLGQVALLRQALEQLAMVHRRLGHLTLADQVEQLTRQLEHDPTALPLDSLLHLFDHWSAGEAVAVR